MRFSVLSNSADKLGNATAIWICRIVVGVAFIMSGWSKSIDPWGFIYKISDYLQVWHLSVPRELILCGAVGLSVAEFTTGICVLTGMLRRVGVWVAGAIMAFMLPLTVYIAIANPVSDCGCFGDMLIVSNSATLIKNIVISLAVIYLIIGGNKRVEPLFTPSSQWLAVTLTVAYGLIIALIGYNVQPLVDFRPYPVGTDLTALMRSDTGAGDEADDIKFIYSRHGQEQAFSIDDLPDSSWTYVRREEPATLRPVSAGGGFAIFDEDGNEVGSQVIQAEGAELLVVVVDPGMHYLSRTRQVNDIARNMRAAGGSVIGIVGAPADVIEVWTDLVLPDFEIYSADDTELKSLVRGDASLVMLSDGKIVWKRTIESLPADFTVGHKSLASMLEVPAVDSGRQIWQLSGTYLALMLLCGTLNFAPRIRRYFRHRRQKVGQVEQNM